MVMAWERMMAEDVNSPRELAERYGEVRPHWACGLMRQRTHRSAHTGWASYLEMARIRELEAGIAEPLGEPAVVSHRPDGRTVVVSRHDVPQLSAEEIAADVLADGWEPGGCPEIAAIVADMRTREAGR